MDDIRSLGFQVDTVPLADVPVRSLLRSFWSTGDGHGRERSTIFVSIAMVVLLSVVSVVLWKGIWTRFAAVTTLDLTWLIYLAISSGVLLPALCYLRSYRSAFPMMTGMMSGMTQGMLAGLLIGTVVGASNGFFMGALVGSAVAMLIGYLAGNRSGVGSVLEGLMAGLMNGSMGGMMGLMLLPDHILWFLPPFFLAATGILWLQLLSVGRDARSRGTIAWQPVPLMTILLVTLVTYLGIALLMMFGPSAGLAR